MLMPWALEGGFGPPWILNLKFSFIFLAKKGYFLNFEREKWNSATFIPRKIFLATCGKTLLAPMVNAKLISPSAQTKSQFFDRKHHSGFPINFHALWV